MCSYCSHVLGEVSIRHTPFECPYRKSMYCSVCVGYGHEPKRCPNKRGWALRRGKMPIEDNIVLRVVDTDEAIKQVLKNNGIEPTTTQTKNRNLLRDLANSMEPPHLIVFTPK